jgi:hypothetical protein
MYVRKYIRDNLHTVDLTLQVTFWCLVFSDLLLII